MFLDSQDDQEIDICQTHLQLYLSFRQLLSTRYVKDTTMELICLRGILLTGAFLQGELLNLKN